MVPAVKAVVEGEPVYASWIPAEFCVIHAGVAQIGGQRLASDDTTRALDQAQTVTWWLICVLLRAHGAVGTRRCQKPRDRAVRASGAD